MRLSTQMHVMNWAEAQCEDPEIEAAMDWCHLDRRKSQPWTEQLTKLKFRLGTKRNTPEGRSIFKNADKLALSGGLLYYRHKPRYQIEEVKHFVIPKAHWKIAIDVCHHDTNHQGKKRMESLICDQFWWPGVFEDVNRAVQNCKQCQLYGWRKEKAPKVPLMVTAPFSWSI